MRQRWLLPAVCLLALMPGVAARAQNEIEARPAAGQPAPDPVVVPIKLSVSPAPVPVPALKYRLLPEVRDLHIGNAALLYYRAFSPEWANVHNRPEVLKALEDWDSAKDVPKILHFVLTDPALREIDRAARRSHCDWELLPRLRQEGIGLAIPDMQGFRTYSHLLVIRARLEMVGGKYDEAVYTLQTGFTFSRHVGDGPIVIQSLVGLAISAQMLGEVEQFIQQKDAPNLYWALTELPRPFLDLRQPLQGEKVLLDQLFPGLREMAQDVNARAMSPREMDHYVDKVLWTMDNLKMMHSREFFNERLGMALVAAKVYPEARTALLAQGRSPKVVDQMPIAQVALIYEAYNYDRYYDELTKWSGLPYPQARAGLALARKQFHEQKARSGSVGVVLAGMLMPAVEKVYESSFRIDRKIAALRCVEAIRLYAAAHDGQLPASLKDVKEVPVPSDPYTGAPFQYERTKDGAVLTAVAPAGERARPMSNTWSYEITLRR